MLVDARFHRDGVGLLFLDVLLRRPLDFGQLVVQVLDDFSESLSHDVGVRDHLSKWAVGVVRGVTFMVLDVAAWVADADGSSLAFCILDITLSPGTSQHLRIDHHQCFASALCVTRIYCARPVDGVWIEMYTLQWNLHPTVVNFTEQG